MTDSTAHLPQSSLYHLITFQWTWTWPPNRLVASLASSVEMVALDSLRAAALSPTTRRPKEQKKDNARAKCTSIPNIVNSLSEGTTMRQISDPIINTRHATNRKRTKQSLTPRPAPSFVLLLWQKRVPWITGNCADHHARSWLKGMTLA